MSRSTTGYSVTKRHLSVFVSYAHEDEEYLAGLERHLKFLSRAGKITIWYDRKLKAGDEWGHHIDEHIEQADIILLLISPFFAESDYCWSKEAKRALERHEHGCAIVVPILIRPSMGWSDTPLGKLQALPLDAKPVTEWQSRDDAYQNIAEGLRHLIHTLPRAVDHIPPALRKWHLLIATLPKDAPRHVDAEKIAVKMRKAAGSLKLGLDKVHEDEARLEFHSTQEVLAALEQLHKEGKLGKQIGLKILDIQSGDPGAVLRIESSIVDASYRSTIRYLPEMFGGRSLEEGSPPFIGGISFPLNNPMKIGFSLLADGNYELLSAEEQSELQARLGRYLNTFLVLKGDQVNVNLNPVDDYCGLPKLLRHTELGRDLLAQDVVLKHYTASELHPSAPRGKAFWYRANRLAREHQNFEACFRVWIVPSKASVREKTEGDQGHVVLEKLGLEVLSEEDYATLSQYRGIRHDRNQEARTCERNAAIVELFRELVLPQIQKEVSIGPRFGLLRQILSVLVVAKWIMGSRLGEILARSGFIGSNTPEKFGLNTVDDSVLVSMKNLYLQLFRDGVWQHTCMKVNKENDYMSPAESSLSAPVNRM